MTNCERWHPTDWCSHGPLTHHRLNHWDKPIWLCAKHHAQVQP